MPRSNKERFIGPKNRPPNPQEAKRMTIGGELLMYVDNFIDLLYSSQNALQLDYVLTFPVVHSADIILPETRLTNPPEHIVITAGYFQTEETDKTPSFKSTAISIDIFSKDEMIQIVRHDETIPDENEKDVVYDMSRKDTTHPTIDLEIASESESERAERESLIAELSQQEINALLVSLALSNGDSDIYNRLSDTNLLEIDKFMMIIEALRPKAAESHTKGLYDFKQGNAEVTFHQDNGKDTFTIAYVDNKAEQITVKVDTTFGVELKFFVRAGDVTIEFSPDSEELKFFKTLVINETKRLNKRITQSAVKVDTVINADDVALEHVDKRDQQEIQELHAEVKRILDQDGFDTPDAG